MALEPGSRLGPYEIISPLGAGGMGEVYRAKDTRLGRDVAVKVLPGHLTDNTEVRSRFEREAKTVSSLNHPNICTLFDVGREGDTDFLVMELIDGETLATRIARGVLPVNDVLKIGSQIADALDRAHRAGVVHRDLKPGNIMLTRSGAKLMDFGLARATGLAGAPGSGVSVAELTQSPTIAQPLTAEGTIVGTFQYMAPEQLEGKETDARSDLWAFGCVLYEMATGKRAFEGRSQASLIGAIMHAEPAPLSQVVPAAPPELDRLIRACLVKDPVDRLQSAHDVKLQLAWLADGSASMTGSAAAPAIPAAKVRSRWPLIVLAAVAGAAVTAAIMIMQRGGGPEPAASLPQRFVVGNANLGINSAPAVSPDGSFVVFSALEGANQHLFRRDMANFQMTVIAGTDGGDGPAISPDGAWIAFITPDAIKKVPATGGVSQVIAPVERVNSMTWGRDGMIYYCPSSGGDGTVALGRVPVSGGAPQVVAKLDSTAAETNGWLPELLPDGKTVLVTIAASTWHLDAVRPDGSRVMLVDNAMLGRYSNGYLAYIDMISQAVLCRPFDPSTLTFHGDAVAITEPVDLTWCYGIGGDGTMVYVPVAGAGEGREVTWLKRDGTSTPAFETRGAWTQPRISPDGTRILVRKIATNCELWMFDIARNSLGRVVQNTDNHDPVWSPDGRRIAYLQSNSGGNTVAQTVEGAREITTIDTGADQAHPASWSEGGNLLVCTVTGRGTRSDIWVVPMDGAAPKGVPFVATTFAEQAPSITRDGKFIAYVTNETGNDEVFVRRYPDSGESWQISVGGGTSPVWSRDARTLFYTSGTRMMSVAVDTRDGFRADRPVQLFDGGFSVGRTHDYDVTPDGRFVAIRAPGGTAGQQELRVLLNWSGQARRMEGPAH